MTDGKTFQLKSHFILDGEMDEGAILIDGHSGTMVSCNDSAAFLLNRLRKGAAAEQLAQWLTETYDVSAAAATRDIARFLDRLGAMGVIDERA